jgi:hypothetical protein
MWKEAVQFKLLSHHWAEEQTSKSEQLVFKPPHEPTCPVKGAKKKMKGVKNEVTKNGSPLNYNRLFHYS